MKVFDLSDSKFNLKHLIDSKPYSKRKLVKKELCFLLRISEKTLERIMYAEITDKQEMSATNLILAADYFNVSPRDLINIPDGIKIGGTILVSNRY